jgi:hypothetical protein
MIGLSKQSVSAILARFGEQRPFLQEGGRTNRGAPGAMATLLAGLRQIKFDEAPESERLHAIDILQPLLVDKVREYHARERLKVSFDPTRSTWYLISELLVAAREDGKDGQVAQYLIGAKLELPFPPTPNDNLTYTTAHDQLGRAGDFLVGDTAFHVTVTPTQGHYERCERNLREGRRAFLLVPNDRLAGTRQNVDVASLAGRVAVESIESFVSQNLEELAQFSGESRKSQILLLLETYNRRVDAVDNDKSVLIEIPENLR